MTYFKFRTVPIFVFIALFSLSSHAADKATSEEVYENVVKAAYVLENLGDEGLEAFMDPKGEFVWKDTYVFVYNCEAGVPAAHPMAPHVVGKKMIEFKDGPKHIFYEVFMKLCKEASNQGKWVEYNWPDKDRNMKRKISFIVQVPGSPYQVVSGIYNDNENIDELNSSISKQ